MAFKTEAQRCKGFSSLFAPVPTYQIRTPSNVLQERENNNQKKNMPVSFEKESSKKIICENTPLTLKAHSWERAKKRDPTNRSFYRLGGHSELIRFKEYYRMPWGHEHISFLFSSAFRDIFS